MEHKDSKDTKETKEKRDWAKELELTGRHRTINIDDTLYALDPTISKLLVREKTILKELDDATNRFSESYYAQYEKNRITEKNLPKDKKRNFRGKYKMPAMQNLDFVMNFRI